MIGTLSSGLGIDFYRVQSRSELEKLISTTNITHLFVGTGEYIANREYIENLSKTRNVALVCDRGFEESTGSSITVLPKPFYGTQAANFLNRQFNAEKIEDLAVSFPGVKALVVDDEHMNLLVAKEIFESYGMVISTASGGENAIEMCEKNDYDIVFMDHMMPGMDGVEAMHIIRQNASKVNRSLIIVALTANAISSAREMFITEGFDGFIPKPIEVTELERVLKKVLPNSCVVYSKFEKKPEPEKETVPSTDESDIISALEALGVDTGYGIDYCGGDKSFYEELLADYAGSLDNKIKEIQGYFEDRDYKNYEIRVHGVKSTSKLIGAMSLSEIAKKLEDAAKEKKEAYITQNHQDFINEYENLMRTISSHLSGREKGGSL